MDEENLAQNPAGEASPEIVEAPKKRRGRKPKALKEAEAAMQNAEAPAEEASAPRARRAKARAASEEELPPRESAEQPAFEPPAEPAADASDGYDEEAEFENNSRRNRERESNIRNDEFSYTGDSDYAEAEADGNGGGDDEIPTHFSTDLADLEPDSYCTRPDEEEDFDEAQSGGEISENAEALQQNRYNQNKNQQNRFRNNQNKQRSQNSRFQNIQNRQRGNSQNRGQQNRGQPQRNLQAQNRNAQNRQQKNQQNKWLKFGDRDIQEVFDPTAYADFEEIKSSEALSAFVQKNIGEQTPVFDYSQYYGLPRAALQEKLAAEGVEFDRYAGADAAFASFLKH
ncbi:MAG: hypothetical protein IKO42_05100, partial [Opitutales bacterium]|nr:hypothetical protein [Opitutales bacterium]